MSLVTVLKTGDRAAAICSDGILVKEEENGITRLGEDTPKFWALTPNIVLACTGNNWLCRALANHFQKFAKLNQDDPALFKYLESAVPWQAKELLKTKPPSEWMGAAIDIMLLGFDGERIRCLAWTSSTDFVSQDFSDAGYLAMGWSEAQAVAMPLLDAITTAKPDPKPEEMCPILEGVVRGVSQAVPNLVNDHTRSFLITPKAPSTVQSVEISEGHCPSSGYISVGSTKIYSTAGITKSARISNDSIGQVFANTVLAQGTTTGTFSGWRNVGTCVLNVPATTASITLTVSVAAQSVGSNVVAYDQIGFGVYNGADPGSPSVSQSFTAGNGFTGNLTLNSPTTGQNITCAVYIHASGGSQNKSNPNASITQNTVSIFQAGVLT